MIICFFFYHCFVWPCPTAFDEQEKSSNSKPHLPNNLEDIPIHIGIQLQEKGIYTMKALSKTTVAKLNILGIKAEDIQLIIEVMEKKGATLQYDFLVDEIGFSIADATIWNNQGVYNLTDFTRLTETQILHYFPKPKVLNKIKSKLTEKGLSLKHDPLRQELGISTPIIIRLNKHGIRSIQDISNKTATELSSELIIPAKTKTDFINEIKEALNKVGHSLKTDPLIDIMGIPLYIAIHLYKKGVRTIEDVTSSTAVQLYTKGVSNKDIERIKAALQERGFSLKSDPLVDIIGLSVVEVATLNHKLNLYTIEDMTQFTQREVRSALNGVTVNSIIQKIESALQKRGLSLKSDPLIDGLGIPVQIVNQLNKINIYTIEELTALKATELFHLYGIKIMDIDTIRNALQKKMFSLKPDPLVDIIGLSLLHTQRLNEHGLNTIESLSQKKAVELWNYLSKHKQRENSIQDKIRSIEKIKRALQEKGLSLKPDPLWDRAGISIDYVAKLNEIGIYTIQDMEKAIEKEQTLSLNSKEDSNAAADFLIKNDGIQKYPLAGIIGIQLAKYLSTIGINDINDLQRMSRRELKDHVTLGPNTQANKNKMIIEIEKILNRRGQHLAQDILIDQIGLTKSEAKSLEIGKGIHTIEDFAKIQEKELFSTVLAEQPEKISNIKAVMQENNIHFKPDPLVDLLNFPPRYAQLLAVRGIHTIEDLLSKTEVDLMIIRLPGGYQDVQKMKQELHKHGLKLSPHPLIEELGLSIWDAKTLVEEFDIHTVQDIQIIPNNLLIRFLSADGVKKSQSRNPNDVF